ncbi:uncharacterized protein [Littorina saxatilis]|uniref:uncharacterized protein n=1 Tax=Littorina saxatilis TaxID=31220 RepID=UPI0038B67302
MTRGESFLSAPNTAGHWLVSLGHPAPMCKGWSSLRHSLSRWKRPLLACQLALILLLLVVLVSRQCARDPAEFQVVMTGEQRELLLDALGEFHTTLQEAGIPFFMYGGTLLGSWRHHGLIPWDDDVDVMVSFASRDKLRKTLELLEPRGYTLNVDQRVRWKLYSSLATPVSGTTWRFPYVDISFYNLTSNHIVDADPYFAPVYVFPKDHVFPLTLRPFEGRQLSAPSNTAAVLNATYNLDICRLKPYSHSEERDVRKCSEVPCSEIQQRVPFVSRRRVGGGVCEESLMLNGTVISRVMLMIDDGCVGSGQRP